MSGGSTQRVILPAKNKKVAGVEETKEGRKAVRPGRPKGFSQMIGKSKR
jgi:hypothetical protein